MSILREWLVGYLAEQDAYSSTAIEYEAKVRRAEVFSADLGAPNQLVLAVAFEVFDEMMGVFGRYETLMRRLRDIFMSAMYVAESDDAGLEERLDQLAGPGAPDGLRLMKEFRDSKTARYYARTPFFVRTRDLGNERSQLLSLTQELRSSLSEWEARKLREIEADMRRGKAQEGWKVAVKRQKQELMVKKLMTRIDRAGANLKRTALKRQASAGDAIDPVEAMDKTASETCTTILEAYDALGEGPGGVGDQWLAMQMLLDKIPAMRVRILKYAAERMAEHEALEAVEGVLKEKPGISVEALARTMKNILHCDRVGWVDGGQAKILTTLVASAPQNWKYVMTCVLEDLTTAEKQSTVRYLTGFAKTLEGEDAYGNSGGDEEALALAAAAKAAAARAAKEGSAATSAASSDDDGNGDGDGDLGSGDGGGDGDGSGDEGDVAGSNAFEHMLEEARSSASAQKVGKYNSTLTRKMLATITTTDRRVLLQDLLQTMEKDALDALVPNLKRGGCLYNPFRALENDDQEALLRSLFHVAEPEVRHEILTEATTEEFMAEAVASRAGAGPDVHPRRFTGKWAMSPWIVHKLNEVDALFAGATDGDGEGEALPRIRILPQQLCEQLYVWLAGMHRAERHLIKAGKHKGGSLPFPEYIYDHLLEEHITPFRVDNHLRGIVDAVGRHSDSHSRVRLLGHLVGVYEDPDTELTRYDERLCPLLLNLISILFPHFSVKTMEAMPEGRMLVSVAEALTAIGDVFVDEDVPYATASLRLTDGRRAKIFDDVQALAVPFHAKAPEEAHKKKVIKAKVDSGRQRKEKRKEEKDPDLRTFETDMMVIDVDELLHLCVRHFWHQVERDNAMLRDLYQQFDSVKGGLADGALDLEEFTSLAKLCAKGTRELSRRKLLSMYKEVQAMDDPAYKDYVTAEAFSLVMSKYGLTPPTDNAKALMTI